MHGKGDLDCCLDRRTDAARPRVRFSRVVFPLLGTVLLGCSIEVPSDIYRCDGTGRCPSPLVCESQPRLVGERYCVRDVMDSGVDAGPDSGPMDGALMDGSPSDNGDAEPPDATLDARPVDSAADALADAADADLDAESDTGPVSDGQMNTSPEPDVVPPPPVSCVAWATTTSEGAIPVGTPLLATETNNLAVPRGGTEGQMPYVHQQYLCSRDRITPGKWIPNFSCHLAVLRDGAWVAEKVDGSNEFSVLVPPVGCELGFEAPGGAGQPPARALDLTQNGNGGVPVYACKAFYDDDGKVGDHLGQVEQGPTGPACRFEYYDRGTVSVGNFQVLVQLKP